MSLIKCSECKKEMSDKAEACPNCGNTSTPKGVFRKRVIGTVGTIKLTVFSIIYFIIIGLLFVFEQNKFGWFLLILLFFIWWFWIRALKKSY